MGEPALEPAGEGTLLAGKYLLEKRLGSGGMGEVYRAQNTLIGRDVAIKILRPEHAQNTEIVTRFLREARAANLVRHHNVVDVLDIGQDEHGTPFIVQELLLGEDLAHRVTDLGGRIPFDVALRILLPVVDAVAFGHAKGVVHRDLKPENVFLARVEGKIVPKLLDFGISQIKGAPNEQRMTATGIAMGTPAYMSPEQIQGHRVDARADVWALGIILHEIISGELPFAAESQAGLFVQVCTAPPITLLQVAPHAPPELEKIILRCLQKAREERYADAAELARDLRKLWESLGASRDGRTSGNHPAATPARSDPDNVLGSTERPKPLARSDHDPVAAASTAIHAPVHAVAHPPSTPRAQAPAAPDFDVPDLALPARIAPAAAPVSSPKIAAQIAAQKAAPSSSRAIPPPSSPTAHATRSNADSFGFDDEDMSVSRGSGLSLESDPLRQPIPHRVRRARPTALESLIPPRDAISFRAILIAFGLLFAIGLGVAGIRYAYETLDVYTSIAAAMAGTRIDTGIIITGGAVLAILGFIALPKAYRSLRDAPALGIGLSLLIALLWFSGLELVVHTFD